MSNPRWDRAQDLFHRVVDLPDAERSRVLAAECGDDDALIAQVLGLLRGDAGSATLLDRDVSHVAHALLDPGDAPALPREPFGPYRATRPLGEGGMGVVYLARREDISSVAAVKVLRDAWLSPARRERFLGEQRTLAQLNHPAIARLYDAGALSDGTPWIAMEYVEGVPLTEYCRSRGASLAERLRLMRVVCEAVLHAHQGLVIHRDLKPANVLVRPDGSVKLLDFGIAKQLEALDSGADVTRTGLRLMTPAYAAPEQVSGGRVGIHTDVYSLGVMLYELLGGRLPFDLSDKTPGQVEAMILGQDPPRPSVQARGGGSAGWTGVAASRAQWADLDVLCLTAMHKDPERRYASVDAVIRDIDHFLDGEPLDAQPDSLRYRAGKFARRNGRALTAAGAVAATVVALSGFYAIRINDARNAALAEAARTQRIQRFMTNLFQGGDEAAGPAESLRVVTLLDQGVREAGGLDLEPEVQADLYQTLGTIYRQLGQFDRADSLLRAGLRQRRRLAGGESAEAARSLVSLADLRIDQARFEEADSLLRSGLATLRRRLPGDDPAVAGALVALGRSIEERGAHDRAIAVLDSAVALLEPHGDPSPELSAALSELGNAHFYAGHYDTADAINRRVLAMTRRLHGDRHPLVAEDLVNLGAAQQERGNYREAERYFREALGITRAFYGPGHYRTAGVLSNLGRAILFQDRYPEAKVELREALRIRERVFGPTHPLVATTLNELGSLANRSGNGDEAEAAYQRVLQIYRAAYPVGNHRIGVATGNLADVYLYRKDYRTAEPLYRDALRIYIETQGPDHLNTGIGYIKLGRCLLREGRFREAEKQTLAGYAIVAKVAAPGVSFLQAARLDLSIMYDSLGRAAEAARFRAERERYLPPPK